MAPAPFIDTSKPEGRPKTIERPVWHGTRLGHHESSPYFQEALDIAKKEKRRIAIPPDHTTESLEKALRALAKRIGQENVALNDVPLVDGNYHATPLSHDSYHILEADDFICSAVAWPADTQEVSVIVKWANEFKIPIWPISIGRNLGYGGSAPRIRGSVVVDLGKKMNKVLEVDVDNATCLVEPGVQYLGLYEHLQKLGVGNDLWIDVPDLPGGSVLGNALERGVGYTPHGDHWGHHVGLEVVLPNGEIIRTGMGSMEGAETWQLFKYGFGPYQDGIFSQSNYGIVTKMGVELLPNPGGIRVFMAAIPKDEDLHTAVEVIRPLMLKKVIGNVPCLRRGVQDATLYYTKADFDCDERGIITDESAQEKIDELKSGAWVFYACVYGPDDVTQAKFNQIKSAFEARIPDIRFYQRGDVPANHYLHNYACFTAGVPTWRELDRMKFVPKAAHLFFAPVSANNGKDARRQSDMCKARMEEYGFNYFGTFFIGTRATHHVISFMYSRVDDEEKKRALACMRALIDDAAKIGVGEYRTHLALQDQVAATYNWNNGAIWKLNELLKDALDPNGILQPGRSGIWGKNWRGKGHELKGGEARSSLCERLGDLNLQELHE